MLTVHNHMLRTWYNYSSGSVNTWSSVLTSGYYADIQQKSMVKEVGKMKGYNVPEGYMGLVNGTYRLFPSDTEYWEYMLENEEV